MRRLFVILMLFTLPIRGLMGDVMAYSMLSIPTPAPATTESSSAKPALASMMATMGHMQRVDMGNLVIPIKASCHETVDSTLPDNNSEKQDCTACQVCHLTITYPFQASSSLLLVPAAHPVQHTSFWHSAELRLSNKPPVL